jgi:Trypsin-like peptidase domain
MNGLAPLSALPGTAPSATWRITNADMADADGRLAIFAIVAFEAQSPKLLGTGFYLQPKGGFATAAHVAIEAQDHLTAAPGSVGIARTLPNGETRFLPIWKFFIHATADVAFGIPRAEFVDDASGQVINAKVLSLTNATPDIGAAVSTWAYPLHRFIEREPAGRVLQLQPDFYDGRLEEFYADRGPSAKLSPPYYRTSIHLHGGASGGPVFFDGHVFGVASSSFEGAEDLAFVTPASALLEIRIPIRIAEADTGETETLGAIATRGHIAMR